MSPRKYLLEGITPSERLIVALDFDTAKEALALVETLGEAVCFYKVGWQLFLGEGWGLLRSLLKKGKKVFLDLKINDIEATVRAALSNMPKEFGGNLELLTIHGNGPTVKAAKAGRNGNSKPYLLMITALSSMDDADLMDVFSTSDRNISMSDYVKFRADRALTAGCDGLIASGNNVKELRETFRDKDFLIVSPGIRPAGYSHDDHKRTLTPYEAIISGSDYLVVGRPITRSRDPLNSAKKIIVDIERALIDLDNPANSKAETHARHKEEFESLLHAAVR